MKKLLNKYKLNKLRDKTTTNEIYFFISFNTPITDSFYNKILSPEDFDKKVKI